MNTMEDYGYIIKDANFLSEVPDDLKCVVCSLVLRQPIEIMKCGHRFCKPCFERNKNRNLNTESRCPIDRDVIDHSKVFEDTALAKVIGNLQVKCFFSRNGCTWTSDLRDLQVHEEQCECQHGVDETAQPDPEIQKVQEASQISVARKRPHTPEPVEGHKHIAVQTELFIGEDFEDTGIASVLGDLQVKCSFSGKGCTWTSDLRDLEVHEEQCQHGVDENLHNESAVAGVEVEPTSLKELYKRICKFDETLEEKEKDAAHLYNEKDKEIDLLREVMKLKGEMIDISNQLKVLLRDHLDELTNKKVDQIMQLSVLKKQSVELTNEKADQIMKLSVLKKQSVDLIKDEATKNKDNV